MDEKATPLLLLVFPGYISIPASAPTMLKTQYLDGHGHRKGYVEQRQSPELLSENAVLKACLLY